MTFLCRCHSMLLSLSLLVTLCDIAASAFVRSNPRRVSFSPPCSSLVVLKETGAEAYLEQCMQDWSELEDELRAFKAGPDQNNELAAADVAEKMLRKALDTARATRDVEFEHASKAHQQYGDALEEEMEGQAALSQLDNDIVGSATQADMVEGLDASYEDIERVRDLSVAHAAHDEGMDWAARVANAEAIASKAKAEFTSAEMKLEMLQRNEQELKAALKELHQAKNILMMKQWEKERPE